MFDMNIVLPSKPKIVEETNTHGRYEIDGLYPGYGHTLGNSLRRIILSSLPGAAITSVKIKGVSHEFSTIAGVKEDVIRIILNLKKVRVLLSTGETQTLRLKGKGVGVLTAKDIEAPGQVTIANLDQEIATITDKSADLDIEMTVEQGLGYVPKERLQKEKVEIGTIALDAAFSPIQRVSYEIENMRVGNRTDFNRLIISVDTDGTISPRKALESSIEIMINQLKAIVGFKEEIIESFHSAPSMDEAESEQNKEEVDDFLKTRVETTDLSQRTINALVNANIRTIGGLARKKSGDINEIDGLGAKGIEEIKDLLQKHGIELKD